MYALLFSLLLYYAFLICAFGDGELHKLRPIRIGLSIDDHSLKDLVILITSVIESAIEPEDLVFHIVACGKDHMAAMVLKKSIEVSLRNCLPDIKHELIHFMLPPESGFALQLAQLKRKSNHWNSQSGADMVRFFMPSIFPHIDRLLYLDNDIIVSCCVEEVWDTTFETDQIVGIALDSLNWATVTQFQRHYNASHPLVIKNMRRNQPEEQRAGKENIEISTKEFSAALPRYPNDGVLLIDVQKYNSKGILDVMNEIALANSRGEYVVNLGTQQFTVLALYDRWKELTPRANLRHFPDMARGYLMWFYYNGFLHYAGQQKPRLLCQTTTAENAQGRIPYLRVMSYSAWALSNYQVYERCPNDHLAYLSDCLPHVHEAPTLHSLYAMLHRIISISPDSALLHIHIGPLHGDFSSVAYQKSDVFAMAFDLAMAGNKTNIPETTIAGDAAELFSLIVLQNSSWSFRVFDYKVSKVEQSAKLLEAGGFSVVRDGADQDASQKKKRGKKEPTPRTIGVHVKHFCDAEISPYKAASSNSSAADNTDTSAKAVSLDATSRKTNPACQSVLPEIKAEGRAHWDVQSILIDVTPPHSFPNIAPNTHTNNAEYKADVGVSISKHSSLGVLLHLDLVFMRPKIVFVRLAASTRTKLAADTRTATRFLRQNGFLTASTTGAECGASKKTVVSPHPSTTVGSAGPVIGGGEGLTVRAALIATVHFSCVWGLRVNEFEFFPNLLT